MKKLEALLNKIGTRVSDSRNLNVKVSKSSVCWHIEHTLLVIGAVLYSVIKSNPSTYKWKFNFKRTFVFCLNKIPRGRVQSPATTIPNRDFSASSLSAHLKMTLQKIKELATLDNDNHFRHPYFGVLNLKSAIKFLNIHTKLHLDIINDILKINRLPCN